MSKTTLPATVRLAVPADADDLYDILVEANDANGIFALSETMARAEMQRAIAQETGYVGVIGAPGRVEAMAYLAFCNMWFSDEPTMEERMLFVREGYRRTHHAKDLFAWAKYTARHFERRLIMSVMSPFRTEAKVELYRRNLSVPSVGSFFIYDGRG
jgi:hypothetical protein